MRRMEEEENQELKDKKYDSRPRRNAKIENQKCENVQNRRLGIYMTIGKRKTGQLQLE